MALSDLAIFSEYTYGTMVETLAYNLDLFNEATQGGLVLRTQAHQGDYSDKTFWPLVTGLVRRRSPYVDGSITEKVMTMRTETIVKVAAGTPPIRIDPAWFAWIMVSPVEAAAVMGQMLAEQAMADMLTVAIGTVVAALTTEGVAVINDISAGSGAAALPSPLALANTSILLGDRMSDIQCWVMHSKSWNDLYGNALSNAERLFKYGTVNVLQDPQGRAYVMADLAGLITVGTPNKFTTIGLTSNGLVIDQQDDYFDNWSTTNGGENIKRTYQAEWSYSVGVKGYAWDKTNGGHAPSNSALFTGTNWDRQMASIKDGPGVLLVSK